MKIIEVRRSEKFYRSWVVIEMPGVEAVFSGTRGRHLATDFARGQFSGGAGEIHVYDAKGENIVEKIRVDGGTQYGQPPP